MAVLPYSRVVNVTLSRADNFPSRRGFGTIGVLTSDTAAGELDSSNKTKIYATLSDVANDHASSTGIYAAASAIFSQNPRPVQFKALWYDSAVAIDKATMKTALDAIVADDPDWYWLCIEDDLRDTVMAQGVIEWTQTQRKFAFIDSNDVLHEDDTDTTNISAVNKGVYDRSGTFYHSTAALYPAVAAAAYAATRNFDDFQSAYTLKFKRLLGITPMDVDSDKLSAITGFTPGLGQAIATGHCANTYIDLGGSRFMVEGSTLTPNVFVDEIHASDWIVSRTEEEILGIFANNPVIPYTNPGMEMLAGGIRKIMQLAHQAGIIAPRLDEDTQEYLPAYVLQVPDVYTATTAAQRKTRVAPAITCQFLYANAIHYATVNYTMQF